jgi:serine protease Do
MLVAVVALVSTRWSARPLPAQQAAPSEGMRVANALSEAFESVAEVVKPSVVQINVVKKAPNLRMRQFPGGQGEGQGEGIPIDPKQMEEMLRQFFGRGGVLPPEVRPQQFPGLQPAEGTGSGFVYDDKGHILTNNHVVADAERILVTFHDGTKEEAKVVGTFAQSDVAVIRVDNTSFPPLKLGQSEDLKVGQWVLAVGSPFGYSQTVTAGIVSATDRDDVGINQFESFIQTDAAINPGNSGGPLVDLTGRVVGINSAIATVTRTYSGVGFAIPIDMAARLADKLIKNGKIERAVMGVSLEQSAMTPSLARQLGLDPKTKGVLVTEVTPDTPAARAGLKVGDVITRFDGKTVHNRRELQYLVMTSDIGQGYPITVLRDGSEVTLQVTLEPFTAVQGKLAERLRNGNGRMPAEREEAAEGADAPEKLDYDSFGVALAPIDRDLARKYRWSVNEGGLIVTGVQPDSPAARAGLEAGDRITKVLVNKKIVPVTSVKEYRDATSGVEEMSLYVEDVRRVLEGQFMPISKKEDLK